MVKPLPFVAPETPDCETTHEKVVSSTEPERAMFVVPLEQIVSEAGVGNTSGVGLTVTTTSTGVPGQPLAVGVTV